ncbi:MAG TPA: HD domain-containing protein [Thermoanaerobaculia bacterium]|nr:HD domain-containing protein [Thermoanaerobaculia bacterium]
MLSIRDPVHGFIRADPLEAALIAGRPFQRLRFIHQLGFTFLVFPGAEHSRFSHALGAMHLAGRVYDALCGKGDGLLPPGSSAPERRLVRAAALLHDLGHAPFSHSAEEAFEDSLDHEEMTRRLIALPEIEHAFARHGEDFEPADVIRLLAGSHDPRATPSRRLLSQVVSGELDVDKMDYLLRDGLYCGVRYGSYDLERLLDTMLPLEDPASGQWGIGVEEGGVHALEALVMARYYMFTQVYFNVTGKALELHFNAWLEENGWRWSADPERFLDEDDVSTWTTMRRSRSPHARAVVAREHFPLAFETREHLGREEKDRFEALLPGLRERFGAGNLLVSNSAKDPHGMGKSRSRVLVRRFDGSLEPMERASQFIRHLARIDRYRVYTPAPLREAVAAALREQWDASGDASGVTLPAGPGE